MLPPDCHAIRIPLGNTRLAETFPLFHVWGLFCFQANLIIDSHERKTNKKQILDQWIKENEIIHNLYSIRIRGSKPFTQKILCLLHIFQFPVYCSNANAIIQIIYRVL